jgi:hypothetical protein
MPFYLPGLNTLPSRAISDFIMAPSSSAELATASEPAAEGDVLFARDRRTAEEQRTLFETAGINLTEGVRGERLADVDAGDLGAQRECQRAYMQRHVNSS